MNFKMFPLGWHPQQHKRLVTFTGVCGAVSDNVKVTRGYVCFISGVTFVTSSEKRKGLLCCCDPYHSKTKIGGQLEEKEPKTVFVPIMSPVVLAFP